MVKTKGTQFDSDKYKEIMGCITSEVFVFIENQLEEELSIFSSAVRKNALPPIKGEITKGKIKWRGIKSFYKRTITGQTEKWLEQRGVIISPIITV